jgi:hypothetical protein
MQRRKFLRFLGIGVTAVAVAPKVLVEAPKPKPHFVAEVPPGRYTMHIRMKPIDGLTEMSEPTDPFEVYLTRFGEEAAIHMDKVFLEATS